MVTQPSKGWQAQTQQTLEEGSLFRRVAVVAQIPSATQLPILWYVKGPPIQIYLTDESGLHNLGYSDLARATADLTLTTSNADIVGATLSLPTADQTYIVIAAFDFDITGVGIGISEGTCIGVLTDSSNNEQGVPSYSHFKIREVGEAQRATVTQVWRLTTTTTDEVYKLRTRKTETGGSITAVVRKDHTTLAASSFLGGATTAATHQHSHDTDITGVSANDHHTHTQLTTKTGAYTITASDEVVIGDAASASFTFTLPAASSNSGKVYWIKKIDATSNTVTVDGNGSDTIDGGLTAVLTRQYESITVISDGTEWWII